jgi:hypothetical protein
MSMQLVINEDTTSMEAAKTDSQPRRKWRLLAAVALLLLIEVGGTVLLCYQCENPAPVPMLQGR